MLLSLPSGVTIAIPSFFWKSGHADLMVRSGEAFYPDHITSRLCLELLDEVLETFPCDSLLDIGCGSGILALLAAFKQVPLVVGLDIDGRAVVLSRENAIRNGLSERVHWFVGTASAIRTRFDCIVANLPYAEIEHILGEVERLLDPAGSLILSGFHDIQWHSLNERLGSVGMAIEKTLSGDQSFYGIPPSGSFTWMGIRVKRMELPD